MVSLFRYNFERYLERMEYVSKGMPDFTQELSTQSIETMANKFFESLPVSDSKIGADIRGFESALYGKFEKEGKIQADDEVMAMFSALVIEGFRYRPNVASNLYFSLERELCVKGNDLANRDELRMIFFTQLLEKFNVECAYNDEHETVDLFVGYIEVILAYLCKNLCYGDRYASALWFYANAANIAFNDGNTFPSIDAFLGILYAVRPELMDKDEGQRYLEILFQEAHRNDLLRTFAAGIYLTGAKGVEPNLQKFLELSYNPIFKPKLAIYSKEKAPEQDDNLVWFHFLGMIFGEDILKIDPVNFYMDAQVASLDELVPNEEFVKRYQESSQKAPLSTAVLSIRNLHFVAYSFKYFLDRRKAEGKEEALDISEAIDYLKSATNESSLFLFTELMLSICNDVYGFTGYDVKDPAECLKMFKKSKIGEAAEYVALSYLFGFVVKQDYKMVRVALKKTSSDVFLSIADTAMNCDELLKKKQSIAELTAKLKKFENFAAMDTIFVSDEPSTMFNESWLSSMYCALPHYVDVINRVDKKENLVGLHFDLSTCSSMSELSQKLAKYLLVTKNPYDKDNIFFLTMRASALYSLAPIDCMLEDKSHFSKDFKLKEMDKKHKDLLKDFYAKPVKVGLKSEYSIFTSRVIEAQKKYTQWFCETSAQNNGESNEPDVVALNTKLKFESLSELTRYDDFVGWDPIYESVKGDGVNITRLTDLMKQQKAKLRAASSKESSSKD